MNSADSQLLRLRELCLLYLDGDLAEEQVRELRECLENSDHGRQYYVEFMMLCSILRRHSNVSPVTVLREGIDDLLGESSLWEALAESEKTAAAVEVPRPVETEALEQAPGTSVPGIEKNRHKVSRLMLYTAISSITVLLLILGYVYTHPRQLPKIVATLENSFGAVWFDGSAIFEEGSELRVGPSHLSAGVAEILFDGGSYVVLQGPCEVDFEGINQLFLKCGRLSVTVEEGTDGFVVRTPTATIVDYGTEFGVKVDEGGQTEAHVFAGKVALRSGSDPVRAGESIMLTIGQAGLVDGMGRVKKIDFTQRHFVRRFLRRSKSWIEGLGVSGNADENEQFLFSDDFDDNEFDVGKWVQVDAENVNANGLSEASGVLRLNSGSYAMAAGDYEHFKMKGLVNPYSGVMGLFIRSDGTVGSGIRIEFWPGGIGGQWAENVLTIMSGDRSVTYANKGWPTGKFDYISAIFKWTVEDDGNTVRFLVEQVDNSSNRASISAAIPGKSEGGRILIGCDEWGSDATCWYDDVVISEIVSANDN
jgi:hypothetical protein